MFISLDIRRELNIFNVKNSTAENKETWTARLNMMSNGRLPKQVLQYKPIGQ